jgi:hypothetical protein
MMAEEEEGMNRARAEEREERVPGRGLVVRERGSAKESECVGGGDCMMAKAEFALQDAQLNHGWEDGLGDDDDSADLMRLWLRVRQ